MDNKELIKKVKGTIEEIENTRLRVNSKKVELEIDIESLEEAIGKTKTEIDKCNTMLAVSKSDVEGLRIELIDLMAV